MAVITLKDFHLGGISQSCYQQSSNTLFRMNGMDVHGEHGILKTSPALSKQSGSTVANKVNKLVSCSDSSCYAFSNGGKVYKRTFGGTYSEAYDGTGRWTTGDILDAEEFNGYIYIATASTLYRWQIGAAWSAVGVTVVGSFTVGDTAYHPMLKKQQELYIGDGKYIAVVDSALTFTATGLNLGQSWRITCLGETPTEVIIGTTTPSNSSGNARVFVWNTYSENVSSSYVVQDSIVNAIMYIDDSIIASAGTQGALYEIAGFRARRIKQIPLGAKTSWMYDATAKCTVYANSVFYINGIPHFGVSYFGAASQIPLGIYSFGGTEGAPPVLTMPYIPSPFATNPLHMVVTACTYTYDNKLLVAWNDTQAGTYGIDENLTSRNNSILISTGWVVPDRRVLTSCKVTIAYRNIPSDWSISATVYNNAESSYSAELRKDSTRNILEGFVNVPNLDSFRVEITGTTPATSSGFDIESIIIETDI